MRIELGCTMSYIKDNETIPFDKMRPSMIISAACKLAQHLHAGLDQLESETTATWRKVIEPLELLHDSFDRVTSVFELLARVNQTLEQTAAVGQGMELVRDFHRRLQQSRALYALLMRIRFGQNAWKEHSNEQLQALDNFLIKMNEGAVQLASNSTTLASFNRLDEEEIELKRKFVDNVHQGTAAFRLTLRDGEHLRGVPHSTLAAMAAAAQKHDMRYSTGSPGAIHPPISAPPLNGAAPTPEWGPWTVTFDPFVYESMMAYCPTRRLRQILFQSYENRASQEPWNNMPVVERLLLVRHDKARLYDLASYADLVGIRRMASPLKASDFLDEIKTPVTLAAVRTLLPIVQLMADSEARGEDVWGDAYVGPESLIDSGGRLTIGRDGEIVLQRRRKEAPYASNETSFTRPMATESPPKIDLRALHWVGIVLKNYTFAPTDCKGLLETVTAQLRPWDVAYWQRRLAFSKQSLVQHGVAPDEIRNYFTLSRVLSGAFGLLHRLWGIHVVESVRDKPPVWHPDVRHFQLFNGTNLLGSFFFDPFARPNKLSIPFTQTLAKRSKEPSPIGVRTPIVVVSTYIQNPEPGEPALLQIENVRNVFHELGHAIQILANQNSEVLITGTTTLPLDLTEMFGQFYELWATEECV
ncbi:M3 peptidase [Helicosporidium sp. ATCC 50920]|nr:M3 peptidase [Helicosporidium sp. ATCC 50920]|eukprot:KDD74202.1 M3 peptidase [Helicosporidium sp. ATCC 50920]